MEPLIKLTMVPFGEPLVTNDSIGKIINGTIGRTPNGDIVKYKNEVITY